jgi:hypothetical protein
MTNPWRHMGVGCLLITMGLADLSTGQTGVYWSFPTPGWVGWFSVPVGIVICVLAILWAEERFGAQETA